MNKENNKSAAGLRRSAVAERIRLREEWSALKEVDSQPTGQLLPISQKRNVNRGPTAKFLRPMPPKCGQSSSSNPPSSSVLCGCVALVEVGSERAALPLRAALAALGASVLPSWSPLVTHLVWAHGGSRSVRARARALACAVVSPLWVEACASAARRLPERSFPAATRPSDLPSPKTLRRLLKKAEMENIPLVDLLSDSSDKEQKMPRLRISSETEDTDTSTDISRDQSTDESRDKSTDISKDKSTDLSKDTTCEKTRNNDSTTDVESRVNTAPRRALPKISESISPRPPTKSRRKLFTQKEGEMNVDEGDKTTSKSTQPLVTQTDKRQLARAERMARRMLAECRPTHTRTLSQTDKHRHRIVLTGMSGEERRLTIEAIRKLKGKIQAEVDHRTTHVLLGTCQKDDDGGTGVLSSRPRTVKSLAGAARGCRVLSTKWATDSASAGQWLHTQQYEVPHLKKISQKARVERTAFHLKRKEYAYDVFQGMRVFVSQNTEQRDGAIQLLKLCGAVVINGQENPGEIHNIWGQHHQMHGQSHQMLGQGHQMLGQGHQMLGKGHQMHGQGHQMHGQSHQITAKTQQKSIKTTQNCFLSQNMLPSQNQVYNSEYDVRIGDKNGDVSSKWVFDSVASGRMRTTRRYVINTMSHSQEISQFLEGC